MSTYLFENYNYPLHTKNVVNFVSKMLQTFSTFTLRTLDNITNSTPQLLSSRSGEAPQAWEGVCFVNGGTMAALVSGPSINHMTRNKHSCS